LLWKTERSALLVHFRTRNWRSRKAEFVANSHVHQQRFSWLCIHDLSNATWSL